MAWQQRVGIGARTDGQDQESRERRLRDVQLAHALQVSECSPAFGDQRWHAGEVAREEHKIGHAPRHLSAAALGDREPRALECRYIVDPVAQHRDVSAFVA
jgi:hypothetical protein